MLLNRFQNRSVKSCVVLAARCVVGGALAASGFLKLMSPPEELALVMESYRLLPLSIVMPLARFMPWGELFAGVCLFLGYGTRVSASAAAGLFTMFLAALLSAFARGLNLNECGCFGRGGPHLSPGQAVFMDVVLLGLTVFVLLDRERRWSLDNFLRLSDA